jgi:hypothetical protein
MVKAPEGVFPVAPVDTGMVPITTPSRTTLRIWRVLSISMCVDGLA